MGKEIGLTAKGLRKKPRPFAALLELQAQTCLHIARGACRCLSQKVARINCVDD
jgi:hypothetical protein